jgi:hypothetical protein
MEFNIGDKVRIARDFNQYVRPVQRFQHQNNYFTVATTTTIEEGIIIVNGDYETWGVIKADVEHYTFKLKLKQPKQFKLNGKHQSK